MAARRTRRRPTRSSATSASPTCARRRSCAPIHPLGKSPVITDNGNTIAESGAIAEYIIATYGNGRLIPPPNTPERLRYTYWLHYAERLGDVAAAAETLVHADAEARAGLLRPLVRKVSNQALTDAGQSAAQAAHGLLGRRTRQRANGSPATNSPAPTSR